MEKKNTQLMMQEKLQEVFQLGYQLREEDLKELFEVQKQAYRAANMIDIDQHIVFALANRFVSSPYIQITTYLSILKESLFSYYVVRAQVKQAYDDDLVNVLYDTYLRHHGEFTKECIMECIQRGRAL